MTQMNVDPAILSHLSDRTVMPKEQFLMLTDEGRLKGFTIAKQADAAVLQDTLNAIRQTTESGGTLWDFKQNFPELLAPYREAGREWHLDLVFRQNVAQAQAVGAHQARQQNKQFLPYVEYHAGPNPRPSHAALDGKIFEVDDPFPLSHTPPWDFNCNCDLISRTRRRAQVAQNADQGRELEEQQVVPGNPKLERPRDRNQMPMAERVGAGGGALYPVDVRQPELKGGEYSFRPDRLNQAVDLSRFDPEIRARLGEALKSVGYTESADGMTMDPPAGGASASKSQISKTQKHVGQVSASKVARPASQMARIARPADEGVGTTRRAA